MYEYRRLRQTRPLLLCLNERKRFRRFVHAQSVLTLSSVGNIQAQRLSASSWRSIPSLYMSDPFYATQPIEFACPLSSAATGVRHTQTRMAYP